MSSNVGLLLRVTGKTRECIISSPLAPRHPLKHARRPLQFELRVPGSQPGAWVTRTGTGPVSDAVSDSESDYRDIGAHVGIRPGPP